MCEGHEGVVLVFIGGLARSVTARAEGRMQAWDVVEFVIVRPASFDGDAAPDRVALHFSQFVAGGEAFQCLPRPVVRVVLKICVRRSDVQPTMAGVEFHDSARLE
jgi:hypothetical protein